MTVKVSETIALAVSSSRGCGRGRGSVAAYPLMLDMDMVVLGLVVDNDTIVFVATLVTSRTCFRPSMIILFLLG